MSHSLIKFRVSQFTVWNLSSTHFSMLGPGPQISQNSTDLRRFPIFIELFIWLWLHTISARRRASRRAESLNQVVEISCFYTVEQNRRNLAQLLLRSFVYLDCVETAIFSNLIYICYFVSYIKPGIKPINYLLCNKQLTLPYGKRLLPLSQLVHVFCFIRNRFIRNSSQIGFLT